MTRRTWAVAVALALTVAAGAAVVIAVAVVIAHAAETKQIAPKVAARGEMVFHSIVS